MWNCRGAAKSSFHKYTKLLIKKYMPDICGFVETRIGLDYLPHIHRWFGASWDVYMVPSGGLSGGTVVLWCKNIGHVTFTHTKRQGLFWCHLLSHFFFLDFGAGICEYAWFDSA